MPLYDLDYNLLNDLGKQTYKLNDVKDQLIRVAADLVRFKSSPIEELWEVKSDADGEYIVARYEDDSPDAPKTTTASTKSPWEAVLSNPLELQLFYKGSAFTKIAHQDAATLQTFLPSKLSTDKSFVSALLTTLSPGRKEEIQKLYPELF